MRLAPLPHRYARRLQHQNVRSDDLSLSPDHYDICSARPARGVRCGDRPYADGNGVPGCRLPLHQDQVYRSHAVPARPLHVDDGPAHRHRYHDRLRDADGADDDDEHGYYNDY